MAGTGPFRAGRRPASSPAEARPIADAPLAAIAAKLGAIEIAMLATRTERGHIAARPMSSNGEVEYDAGPFYITDEGSRTVSDIGRDARVALAFTARDGPGARSSRRTGRWFVDGVDTKGCSRG